MYIYIHVYLSIDLSIYIYISHVWTNAQDVVGMRIGPTNITGK